MENIAVHVIAGLSKSLNTTPFFGNQTTISSPGQQRDQLNCSKDFFYDENVTNFCRPICEQFTPIPLGAQVLEHAAIVTAFIFSIIMFILALTVHRDLL